MATHPDPAPTASDTTIATGLRIHEQPLSYEQALPVRDSDSIDLVVIHCTELPDLPTAREYGEHIHYPETGTGNAGHYYIDRDGRVEQWVAPGRVAHHVRGFNERSIGIEIVNNGRYPDWLHSRNQTMQEPYTEAQIIALMKLLTHLAGSFAAARWIAGHEDLDRGLVPASDDATVMVHRKLDPGPMFPWQRVLDSGPLQRFAG